MPEKRLFGVSCWSSCDLWWISFFNCKSLSDSSATALSLSLCWWWSNSAFNYIFSTILIDLQWVIMYSRFNCFGDSFKCMFTWLMMWFYDFCIFPVDLHMMNMHNCANFPILLIDYSHRWGMPCHGNNTLLLSAMSDEITPCLVTCDEM